MFLDVFHSIICVFPSFPVEDIHPHQGAGIAAYIGDEMRANMAAELGITALISKKNQE